MQLAVWGPNKWRTEEAWWTKEGGAMMEKTKENDKRGSKREDVQQHSALTVANSSILERLSCAALCCRVCFEVGLVVSFAYRSVEPVQALSPC